MKEILLSIIIPIYNTEKYLVKCLDSIVSQAFDDNIEVICVDDGSTDMSSDICDLYERKYSFIQVIHIENGGVSKARNVGLDNAKGKYIAWVDSDDYIANDWYKNIKKYMYQDYDLIYFDMKIIFLDGKSRNKYYSWRDKELSFNEFHYDLAAGLISSQLWSKICKKEYWTDIRFSVDMSYCEDYSLLHKILIKARRIRYIHKPLYNYLQRENSIVHDVKEMNKNAIMGIQMAQERIEFYKNKNIMVSKDGWYLAIDIFLWNYLKSVDKRDYSVYYNEYYNILKESMFEWMFSRRIILRKKIQMLMIVTKIAELIVGR